MQQETKRRGGIHKQEHTGAQTSPTSGKEGSDKNQIWLVTVIDEGMWECVFQINFLNRDLVNWETKRKERKSETKYSETQNCKNKHGDNDKKQISPLTLIDGLSRDYRCHFQKISLNFTTDKIVNQGDLRMRKAWESIKLYKSRGVHRRKKEQWGTKKGWTEKDIKGASCV